MRSRCKQRPDSTAGWSCVVLCASRFPFLPYRPSVPCGQEPSRLMRARRRSGETAVRLVPGRADYVQGNECDVKGYDRLGVVEAHTKDRLELLEPVVEGRTAQPELRSGARLVGTIPEEHAQDVLQVGVIDVVVNEERRQLPLHEQLKTGIVLEQVEEPAEPDVGEGEIEP